jgi:hypothetical protein
MRSKQFASSYFEVNCHRRLGTISRAQAKESIVVVHGMHKGASAAVQQLLSLDPTQANEGTNGVHVVQEWPNMDERHI